MTEQKEIKIQYAGQEVIYHVNTQKWDYAGVPEDVVKLLSPEKYNGIVDILKAEVIEYQAHREREQALKQALKAQEPQPSPMEIQLKPFPTEPIAHLRLTADSRKIYETMGKLASLNVAFTSDFQPKPLSVDLTNVKIGDALRIVSYQTKTFWKAATPNTILVIPDTPGNRRDYEQEVLRTIYLTNPLAPADRTAITTALKQVLGIQRIIAPGVGVREAVLLELAEAAREEKARAEGAVDRTVVGRQGHRHDGGDRQRAVLDHRALFARADREIDALVYDLYGLSADERRLVEEAVGR